MPLLPRARCRPSRTHAHPRDVFWSVSIVMPVMRGWGDNRDLRNGSSLLLGWCGKAGPRADEEGAHQGVLVVVAVEAARVVDVASVLPLEVHLAPLDQRPAGLGDDLSEGAIRSLLEKWYRSGMSTSRR